MSTLLAPIPLPVVSRESMMTHCIGLDPGNEHSAIVVWNGQRIDVLRYGPNEDILALLKSWTAGPRIMPLVIEQVASYGMAVGETVFETVFWSGRFAEAYGMDRVRRMKRLVVKQHLCHDSRAKDANIRQAIIDRFGGKDKAIGKKAEPGPLFGVSGDLWSALAVALTWWDQNAQAELFQGVG